MGVKILLADDSPTVHKVIKIILANEPFELVECSNEKELAQRLTDHQPSAVFLDFNFSETRTGYDLCREIKRQRPEAKVLMMYGTFDTVDEGTLQNVGVDQYVVKPFDTNKFVQQVRSLMQGTTSSSESWETRDAMERKSPNLEKMVNETVDLLDESLSEWGMSVPGIIGKTSGSQEIPPVIEAPVTKKENLKSTPYVPFVEKLPEESDLEYPEVKAPKSKLIPIDELKDLEPSEPIILETPAAASLGEVDVKHIEDQIRDEVEADLWTVDTFQDAPARLTVVKEESISWESPEEEGLSFRVQEDEKPSKGDHFLSFEDETPTRSTAGMPSDIESLRPMIKQLVEEVVREVCRERVDKIAWDIIPDLAENLIKKELQQISQKVTRDL